MHIQVRHWGVMGAVFLLLTGPALAAATVPEEVAKNKVAYTQKLQELNKESEAVKPDLLARYRKTLDAFRLAAKQKGDFDAVQSVDEEIARYDKQKKLPPATPPPANADIAKAAALCREALDKADLDGARKVIELTDRYLQFLDLHVKQAVRDDKLDLAKSFDSEMKATRETPEYQAAKFVIADKAAATAPPPKADPVEPPQATESGKPPAVATNIPQPVLAPTRIGPNGEKITPRVDPDGLYDASRIMEGAPAATLGTPTSYKQLSSSETGKAPITGGVGIAMDGYLDGENARYQLRFKLRTKTAGTTMVNLKVLVQYFVKNPNGGALQEARMQFALISQFGAKSITCEMKPTDLPFAYTYHYRGGNFVEDREGAFAGTLVSVFSAEDKLLGQVTSAPALKDRGKTTFELPKTWEDHATDMPLGGVPPARPRRRPPADNN